MIGRNLAPSFATSVSIHLLLVPLVSLFIHSKPQLYLHVPVELVDVAPVPEATKVDAPPPPKPRLAAPAPKLNPQQVTAPKLLSKPEIFDIPPPTAGNVKEQVNEPERPLEDLTKLAGLPDIPGAARGGWNVGSTTNEAEGAAAGAGNLFGKGEVGVVAGKGVQGGGGGTGNTGLGRGAKGDGSGGGGTGSGEATAGIARPLGGYQVRPRYPESARRAGAQGVTLLKLLVLENGKVGEVLIEQSAGHRDLDAAAADAVKKWRFEPARAGKQPVSVWVLLPVNFELN